MNNRVMIIGVVCVMLLGPALYMAAGSEKSKPEAAMPLDKVAAAMVNAKEHGAAGNGDADNTQALQAALNAAENKGPVKLSNCGFWGVPQTKEQVVKHGPSSLMLNGCHFTGWDAGKKGEPCIRADGGRMVVNGCEFMDAGKKAIVLEKGLKAATITGCLLRGSDGIVNESGADIQVGMNTSQ
jgi:hypothetical protein